MPKTIFHFNRIRKDKRDDVGIVPYKIKMNCVGDGAHTVPFGIVMLQNDLFDSPIYLIYIIFSLLYIKFQYVGIDKFAVLMYNCIH